MVSGCEDAPKKRDGRGRPTDLTPKVERAICEAVRAGNFPSAAARSSGVAPRTFFKWMRRGLDEPESIYGQFRREVKKAEQDSEVALIHEWRQHTSKNWMACAALLERRFPKRWSRPQQVQVQASVKITDARDEIIAKLARLAGDLPEELVGEVGPVGALPSVSIDGDG